MPEEKYKECREHGTVLEPITFYSSFINSQVPIHWHVETEILYVYRGEVYVEVNMQPLTLKKGEFCCFGSNDLHIIRSDNNAEHCALLFNMNAISFAQHDAMQQELINPILAQRLLLPLTITAADTGYSGYVERFFQIAEYSQQSSYIEAKLALLELIVALYRGKALVKAERTANASLYQIEYIKKAISYIEKNYASKIYIPDLAQKINLSPGYFCRFFKKMTGKPPVEYLNSVRLENAAAMLLKSSKTATEIALECGFDNYSYFSRTFKEKHGVTPEKFRKEINSQ